MRSRLWQGISLQSFLSGFPGVLITVAVVVMPGFLAGEPVVQPDTSNAITRTTMHIPRMKKGLIT
jgi:hypothetical protein